MEVNEKLESISDNKMPFVNIKKQYLAVGMLVYVALFFFNSRQSFQCQFAIETTFHPIIYGITPTSAEITQKAVLTRLSQTLMLVKNFHWIVIENSHNKTKLVENLLQESTLNYTHLNIKSETPESKLPRASFVDQRNLGLSWLRFHLQNNEDKRGAVFFMDEDNTYSWKVFEEMRKIKKVGVWPVGLVGGRRVEMPLVTDGKITGFNAVWRPSRPFPIDIASFAINATLFLNHPEAKFSRKCPYKFQESEILKYFTTREELEPLAENCTKVYVWHTRTREPSLCIYKTLKHPVFPDDYIEV